MQDRIKQMAEEAGFRLEPGMDAGYIDFDELARFAQIVAEDCAKVALEHPCEERGARRPQIASAIRARYGIKE